MGAIEERGYLIGLIRMSTMSADYLAKLLLDVRCVEVEDRIISNGFGCIPWGYQGVVVQLLPFPWVRWDGLARPREVEVELRVDEHDVGGRYRLLETGREKKGDRRLPTY